MSTVGGPCNLIYPGFGFLVIGEKKKHLMRVDVAQETESRESQGPKVSLEVTIDDKRCHPKSFAFPRANTSIAVSNKFHVRIAKCGSSFGASFGFGTCPHHMSEKSVRMRNSPFLLENPLCSTSL